MRLYTTTGATQVDDPEHGTFTADANGAFDGLPDEMYAKLHGRPGWENDPERELRVAREELDRFRDPAELLKAVRELGANQGILAQALAQALGVQGPVGETPAPAPVEVEKTAVEIPTDSAGETPENPEPAAAEVPVVTAQAKTSRSRKTAAASQSR